MKPIDLARRREEQDADRQLEAATQKFLEVLAEMSSAQHKLRQARKQQE